MKKLILPLSLCFCTILFFTNCSRKTTPIQKETGAVEVTTPFSSKEYRSDSEFFRAVQSSNSNQLASAKKKAKLNACAGMAADIDRIVKIVTRTFLQEITTDKAQELGDIFQEEVRQGVNEEMSNVREIGEKNFKETDGTYTCWIAIEVNKKEVFESIGSKISKNEKLQLFYDQQKFERFFNEEQEKLNKD
jgi:hypothetical protein